jgi:hypothetical protein
MRRVVLLKRYQQVVAGEIDRFRATAHGVKSLEDLIKLHQGQCVTIKLTAVVNA